MLGAFSAVHNIIVLNGKSPHITAKLLLDCLIYEWYFLIPVRAPGNKGIMTLRHVRYRRQFSHILAARGELLGRELMRPQESLDLLAPIIITLSER